MQKKAEIDEEIQSLLKKVQETKLGDKDSEKILTSLEKRLNDLGVKITILKNEKDFDKFFNN